MKKRLVYWLIWLLLALCLYFFENNTGTRIVLACTILLPLIPAVRRAVTDSDEVQKSTAALPQTVKTFSAKAEEDAGDVRDYVPGDPVNRIHWKLSAKRDSLLVRSQARDVAPEESEKESPAAETPSAALTHRKSAIVISLIVAVLALLLLFAIPAARLGAQALANRLFEASEAANAYVYIRFPVPDGQPAAPAILLLSAAMAAYLFAAAASGSRLMILILLAGSAAVQTYFGLTLPGWANVLLFLLFALWMLRRPVERRTIILILSVVTAVSLIVLLVCPGVDASTESASEQIRDRLSQVSRFIAGTASELPSGENETRRTHTVSVTAGDNEAASDKEYRLLTVEEEQISMPRWINYLKIALLMLLTVALVILPFLPFLILNARRKKALELRKRFESEDAAEAVCAIFQQVIRWLDATGHGAGNSLYAEWTPPDTSQFPRDYAEKFKQCAKLFEEAAYSCHTVQEEQRQQTLALLDETEKTLSAELDWKQRFRLRYRECLWI